MRANSSHHSLCVAMALVLSGCVTSISSQGRDEDGTTEKACLQLVEKLQKTKGGFVGFGAGLTDRLAVENATQDMVRQIRTKVTASLSVHETNTSVNFEALGGSSVDELLVGLVVEKRCTEGNRWNAVVSISKPLLLRNLQTTISQDLSEVERLLNRLSANDDAAVKLNAAVEGRKFLISKKPVIRDTLNLCTTLNGCLETSAAVLQKLDSSSSAILAQNSFFVEPQGDEASKVTSSIASLIAEEGFQVASSSSAPGKAKVTCFRRDFPKMDGTSYLITEISCTAVFEVKGQAAFSRKYFGKGLGTNREESLGAARRQLAAANDT